MRRTGAILAALMLAGCTEEGLNPIVAAGVAQVRAVVPGTPAAPDEPQVLTRADIEAAGTAAIRARALAGERGALMFAAAQNAGYVTYSSGLRQTLTLRGSQLTATRGIGHDLVSATSSSPDPLAQAIPPQNWPAEVTRTYEFPADAPRGRIERYTCRFSLGEVRTIAILTVEHRGVEVTETCTGEHGEFENLHFAELGSGFVWRSIQWSGAEQGPIDIEVIVPFGGR